MAYRNYVNYPIDSLHGDEMYFENAYDPYLESDDIYCAYVECEECGELTKIEPSNNNN